MDRHGNVESDNRLDEDFALNVNADGSLIVYCAKALGAVVLSVMSRGADAKRTNQRRFILKTRQVCPNPNIASVDLDSCSIPSRSRLFHDMGFLIQTAGVPTHNAQPSSCRRIRR